MPPTSWHGSTQRRPSHPTREPPVIVPVCLLIGIAIVALSGRSLRPLGEIRLRRPALVVIALLIQIVVIEVLPTDTSHIVSASLHVASYALAMAFVASNRAHVGIVLLGIGGLCNLAAITANDGVMPADPAAMELAGVGGEGPGVDQGFQNSAADSDAELAFLGDVFAVPEGVPFANVFSVGDVLVVVGGWTLVIQTCWRRSSIDCELSSPSEGAPVAAVRTR